MVDDGVEVVKDTVDQVDKTIKGKHVNSTDDEDSYENKASNTDSNSTEHESHASKKDKKAT